MEDDGGARRLRKRLPSDIDIQPHHGLHDLHDSAGATADCLDPELRAVEEVTTLTRLQPGIQYRHSGLETPFTIEPELDGWAVEEIGRRFIQLESNHPDAGPDGNATGAVRRCHHYIRFYSSSFCMRHWRHDARQGADRDRQLESAVTRPVARCLVPRDRYRAHHDA